MTYVLYGLSLLCLLYFLLILWYAGKQVDFLWIWPAFAAGLAGTGALLEMLRRMECGTGERAFLAGLLYRGVATLLLVLFAALCGVLVFIWRAALHKPARDLDWLVILGAHVEGEKPSRSLQMRIDTAYQYALQSPRTRLILSGAMGEGEQITEAECMRRELTRRGLEAERLILEEQSCTTYENLSFSAALTGCEDAPTGIVTNGFHLARALKLAKRLGYTQVQTVPAPSGKVLLVHFTLREVFALGKAKVTGKL